MAWYGPFVMNTQEAFTDYHAGKLGVIPADVMPHTSDFGDDATPGE
jgi:hypothetical protein